MNKETNNTSKKKNESENPTLGCKAKNLAKKGVAAAEQTAKNPKFWKGVGIVAGAIIVGALLGNASRKSSRRSGPLINDPHVMAREQSRIAARRMAGK